MRLVLYSIAIYLLLLLVTIYSYADVQSTGAKVAPTIMIIDTGVDQPHFALKHFVLHCFDPVDCQDVNGHGTHVTSLVLNGELDYPAKAESPVCAETVVYICNYTAIAANGRLEYCYDQAIKLKVDLVNYSSTGPGFIQPEYDRIRAMGANHTRFVTAVGNEGTNLRENPKYPAMYAFIDMLNNRYARLLNVIPVGGLTRHNQRYSLSNYGIAMQLEQATFVRSADKGNQITLRSGTSMATALHTNKLLRTLCTERGFKLPEP